MYFLLFKGWRWAFFISGIPGILVGILLFITVQEPERTTGKATEEKSETIVKEKPLQRLVKILKPFLAPSLILAVLAGSVRNAGKTHFFLCPQRNFGRHIVITLSVHPASCPVHISYIFWGRNSKFVVWMHLGMAECRIPFSGQCDLVFA